MMIVGFVVFVVIIATSLFLITTADAIPSSLVDARRAGSVEFRGGGVGGDVGVGGSKRLSLSSSSLSPPSPLFPSPPFRETTGGRREEAAARSRIQRAALPRRAYSSSPLLPPSPPRPRPSVRDDNVDDDAGSTASARVDEDGISAARGGRRSGDVARLVLAISSGGGGHGYRHGRGLFSSSSSSPPPPPFGSMGGSGFARREGGGGGGYSFSSLSSSNAAPPPPPAAIAIVETVAGLIASCVRAALPPTVACARAIVVGYRALPKDALLAQAGLVYCFTGGSYPTLFAVLQAARQCGWESAVKAIDDIAHEATVAVRASYSSHKSGSGSREEREESGSNDEGGDLPTATSTRDAFMRNVSIVFATVDPAKLNQAVKSLYTTWMGIEAVLRQEFARTVTLSLSIQGYIQPIVDCIVTPPAKLCVPDAYHRWIPVLLEWSCRGVAMAAAWRIQRVLSAATSAVAGGLMFSRAVVRMLSRRGWVLFGSNSGDDERTVLDEVVGLAIACLGLYVQIGNGFRVNLPFPLTLVTVPFDFAEWWIQWQITKDVER